MLIFMADEYSVCLPDGKEIHRYDPKTRKHTVDDCVNLYYQGERVCSFMMGEMSSEARLLVWIMAVHRWFGEENKKTSSELWDRVPIDFPPRMHTLSPGYDGLHGPFGRGLDEIRKNLPPWFRYKKRDDGKMVHWLELPSKEAWLSDEDVTLFPEVPPKQPAPLERHALVGKHLRDLANRIEQDDRNTAATMQTREDRPLRPWYVVGQAEPQGFEYDGPHTIEVKIVLPRRVGERVSSDTSDSQG